MSLGGGNQVVPPQEGDQAVGHGLVLFGGGVTVAALVGAAGQGTDVIHVSPAPVHSGAGFHFHFILLLYLISVSFS